MSSTQTSGPGSASPSWLAKQKSKLTRAEQRTLLNWITSKGVRYCEDDCFNRPPGKTGKYVIVDSRDDLKPTLTNEMKATLNSLGQDMQIYQHSHFVWGKEAKIPDKLRILFATGAALQDNLPDAATFHDATQLTHQNITDRALKEFKEDTNTLVWTANQDSRTMSASSQRLYDKFEVRMDTNVFRNSARRYVLRKNDSSFYRDTEGLVDRFEELKRCSGFAKALADFEAKQEAEKQSSTSPTDDDTVPLLGSST